MRPLTRYIGNNNLENAVFPLQFMYITQGENGGYSHQGTYAIDFQGMSSISSRQYRCPYYAPCDMELVAIADSNNHGYVYTSINNVNFIDGTTGKLTLLVAHDNTSYSVGRRVMQGYELGKTGTYGNVTGDHVHMEAKKGNYEGIIQNQQGIYMLKNSTHIYNLIGVNDTILLVDMGYNWREFSSSPTPPSIRKKSTFPWAIYMLKVRNKYMIKGKRN